MMVVRMSMLSMLLTAHFAVHLIRLTPLHLHLHRRVIDVEMMLQFFRHGTQDLLAFADALLCNNNMTTARDHARADGPDVKIVSIEHAGHGTDRLFHRLH